MSLVRMGWRIAAVEALLGRTMVDANVLDSQIGALFVSADGSLRTDQEKEFVAIYTDAGTVTGELTLRSLHGNGSCELVFEFGIAASMQERNPDTGVAEVIAGLPATDDAFEFKLDAIERQIVDALSDPDNEWAQLAAGLVEQITKVERARIGAADKGTRLAGQQLKLKASMMPDPLRGDVLTIDMPFGALLAKMEAVDDPAAPLRVKAALMRGLLVGANDAVAQLERRHGMTAGEAFRLGLGPLVAPLEGDVETLGVGSLDIEGRGVTSVEGDD